MSSPRARSTGFDGYGSRLLAFVLAPLLFPQSRVVLSHLPVLPEAAGDWSGTVEGNEPLRLLVLGDSTAAGVGVDELRDGVGGNIARIIAERQQRGVEWTVLARSGATTGEIRNFLLSTATRREYDIVFLTTGVNDVMQLRTKRSFVHDLTAILEALRLSSPDARILLAGIPRMENFTSLPDPLGTILGARAYRLNAGAHAAAQGYNAVVHVPPWPIRTPGFFAADNFHPSAVGYRAWAASTIDYWLRAP